MLHNHILEDDYTQYPDYENIEYLTHETPTECVDSEDCEELGILDVESCEFAAWANDRCPLTCGQCTTNETPKQCVDSEDCEELGIVDIDSCEFAPWANEKCPVTCDKCTTNEDEYFQYTDYESITTDNTPTECVDSEDCKELGIVDEDSCEFASWANDRCPVTCGKCIDECKDQPDCEELGIIDSDSCEFAAWASDRCPVTCNACKR